MKATALDILKAAQEHIRDPAMWYQGGWARLGLLGAVAGQPCCLLGALHWAAKQARCEISLLNEAHAALRRQCPEKCLGDINDDPSTTHADVMAIYTAAIKSLEGST